jgi:hypothetical protein
VAVKDAPPFGMQGNLTAVLPFCQVAQARVLEHLEHRESDKNSTEQEGKASYHQT